MLMDDSSQLGGDALAGVDGDDMFDREGVDRGAGDERVTGDKLEDRFGDIRRKQHRTGDLRGDGGSRVANLASVCHQFFARHA